MLIRFLNYLTQKRVRAEIVSDQKEIPAYWMVIPEYQHFEKLIKKAVITGNVKLSHYFDSYEHYAIRMLKEPRDAVLLDIGANIGLVTLPVAAIGKRVIAIEPVLLNLRCLKESIQWNGFQSRVTVIPNIAYDEEMEMPIYVPILREDNACLSKTGANAHVGGKVSKEVARSIVLDEWLDANSRLASDITFIKIDVQGYELRVLKGMPKFLRTHVSRLTVECEFDPKLMACAGIHPAEIFNYMEGFGYSAFYDGRLISNADWEKLQTADIIFCKGTSCRNGESSMKL